MMPDTDIGKLRELAEAAPLATAASIIAAVPALVAELVGLRTEVDQLQRLSDEQSHLLARVDQPITTLVVQLEQVERERDQLRTWARLVIEQEHDLFCDCNTNLPHWRSTCPDQAEAQQ